MPWHRATTSWDTSDGLTCAHFPMTEYIEALCFHKIHWPSLFFKELLGGVQCPCLFGNTSMITLHVGHAFPWKTGLDGFNTFQAVSNSSTENQPGLLKHVENPGDLIQPWWFDGWNPVNSPVKVGSLLVYAPLFLRFKHHPSVVVWDFWTIKSSSQMLSITLYKSFQPWCEVNIICSYPTNVSWIV